MIYTITLNPALDYVVKLDECRLGEVNRSYNEVIHYGGKGINVSYVLNELCIDSICLGFIGGFTGKELKRGVREVLELNEDFIEVKDGMTRINVKMHGKEETEVNGSGPCILEEELNLLLYQLEKLNDGDILVLSGSVPKGMDAYVYCSMMEFVKHKNIKVVVDAGGDYLMNTLSYHPFMIKPNQYELAAMFNTELETMDDIEYYARKLKDMGAVNVLISMGKDGCMLIDEYGHIHHQKACIGEAVNTVGAGDSMVAGFIAGIERGYDYPDILKLATACGSATAFSSSLAKHNEIEELLLDL